MNAALVEVPQMAEKKEKIVQTTVRMPVGLRRALGAHVDSRRFTDDQITVDAAINEAVRDWLERIESPVETPNQTIKSGTIDALVGNDDGLRELVEEFVRLIKNPVREDRTLSDIVQEALVKRIAARKSANS